MLAALRAWAGSELGSRPEVGRVILIGSLAHGTWSAGSDADVVVVVDVDPGPPSEREASYRPRDSLGIGLDLFVRTPDELAAMGERFVGEVADGVVLFDREASGGVGGDAPRPASAP